MLIGNPLPTLHSIYLTHVNCTNDQALEQLQYWECLHHSASGESRPCTSLAVCGGTGGVGVNIVTGGEDGRITVLRTSDLQPLTIIGMSGIFSQLV